MAKIKIENLPKGFEVVNGKIIEKKQYGGMLTGDQSNYGLVTTNPSMDVDRENGVDVRFSLSKVPRDLANIEAEGGETVLTDLNGDGMFGLYDIKGPRHSQGGVPMYLPPQSFVFSDFNQMKLDSTQIAELGIETRKKKTPAALSRKFGLNEYYGKIKDPYADSIQVRSAELMMDKNKNKLSHLAFLQEAKKGFEEGVPVSSYPFLVKQGIDPIEFTQKVENISEQQAQQKLIESLPYEQQMQIAALQQYMAQVDQQQAQQQGMQEGMMPQEQGMEQSMMPQEQGMQQMPPQMQQGMPPQEQEMLPPPGMNQQQLAQFGMEIRRSKLPTAQTGTEQQLQAEEGQSAFDIDNINILNDWLDQSGLSSMKIDQDSLIDNPSIYEEATKIVEAIRQTDGLADFTQKELESVLRGFIKQNTPNIDGLINKGVSTSNNQNLPEGYKNLENALLNPSPEVSQTLDRAYEQYKKEAQSAGAKILPKEQLIESLLDFQKNNTQVKQILGDQSLDPKINANASIGKGENQFTQETFDRLAEENPNYSGYKIDKDLVKNLQVFSKVLKEYPSTFDVSDNLSGPDGLYGTNTAQTIINVKPKQKKVGKEEENRFVDPNEIYDYTEDMLKMFNPTEQETQEESDNTSNSTPDKKDKWKRTRIEVRYGDDDDDVTVTTDPTDPTDPTTDKKYPPGFTPTPFNMPPIVTKSIKQDFPQETVKKVPEKLRPGQVGDVKKYPPAGFFPQDLMKMDAIAKRERDAFFPFQPAVMPNEFGYVLEDQRQQEAMLAGLANTGMQALGAFTGTQGLSSRMAASKTPDQIAKLMSGVNQRNVNTINRGKMMQARNDIALAAEERKRQTKLYDDTQTTLQNYMNELNFDREQFTDATIQAYDNRAKARNLNTLSDNFSIRPELFGEIVMTNPDAFSKETTKDRDQLVNEFMKLNDQYQEINPGKTLSQEAFLNYLGINTNKKTKTKKEKAEEEFLNMTNMKNSKTNTKKKGGTIRKYAVPFYAGKIGY
jgi:hypothetical protein